MTAQFGYLLNAMERAACESNPAEHGKSAEYTYPRISAARPAPMIPATSSAWTPATVAG